MPGRRLRYRVVVLPLILLFVVRTALVSLRVKGAGVKQREGMTLTEQLLQMIHVCLSNWGHLVPEDYYVYALYRPEQRRFAAASGHNLHVRGLIDLGIVALGGKTDERFSSLLTDKVRFHRFCRDKGFPTPSSTAVFSGSDVRWLDADEGAIPPRDLFVKPVGGAVGSGTSRVFFLQGEDAFRLDGDDPSLCLDRAALVERLEELSVAEPLLLQDRLDNHPELARLVGANTLCTLRVFTVRILPDSFEQVAAFLRFPLRDVASDNFAAGGLACVVDLESGALSPAYRKYGPERLDTHPYSGIRFSDFRLPLHADVKELCIVAHPVFVEADQHYRMPVIGWDVAVTPDGPVFVEANSPCDLRLQKGLEEPLFTNPHFRRCFESHLEEYRTRLGH
jgi:hypothetical protein